MPDFKLEFDRDLTEDEQNLVTEVMMQIEPQASAAESTVVAEEREACAVLVEAKANRILIQADRFIGTTKYAEEAKILQYDAAALQVVAREIRSRASGGNGGAGEEGK